MKRDQVRQLREKLEIPETATDYQKLMYKVEANWCRTILKQLKSHNIDLADVNMALLRECDTAVALAASINERIDGTELDTVH